MLNKALRIGQLIMNAHPSDVRSLFQAYGIKAEPTGKTIMDAYLVYGKPFLLDLFNIGYRNVSTFSSATGDTYGLETGKLTVYEQAAKDKAASDAAKAKGTTFDGISNWFDIAAKVLTTVAGGYNIFSGIFSGNKTVDTGTLNPNAAINDAMRQAKLDAQAAADANSTKTYLLIGAGIVVAVLVLIMFLKHK
jgi:hypothetical protein